MDDASDGLTLLELAVRGRWNTAVERAARFPAEIIEQNEDGLNALHLAAVNFPLAHLFSEMLRIDEEYVEEACLAKDHSGMTPLLCAAALFAPLEMMQALVEACPEAVRAKDSFGATALHHVCARSRRGFSSLRRALARAEILLEIEPSLANEQDDIGMMPIHALCQEYEEDINTYWLSHEPDVQLGMLRFDVDGLWLFIETLLRRGEQRSGNILHKIVSLPSPPLALVIFASRRLKAMGSEQDGDGNTPLHLALQRRLWDVACVLVRHCNASTKVVNNRGETPLQIATRSASSFNRCLYMLIARYPKAVKELVAQDNLYPILFKSISHWSELDAPSPFFDILKLRPDLVNGGDTGP